MKSAVTARLFKAVYEDRSAATEDKYTSTKIIETGDTDCASTGNTDVQSHMSDERWLKEAARRLVNRVSSREIVDTCSSVSST